MTYDSIVIGAGLAGLTAALRLAEQGQRVLVVAKGVGGTHLAPPTIDVLGYVGGQPVERPLGALGEFVTASPEHPYARVGLETIRAGLEWLTGALGELGYSGGLEENLRLPTAVGVAKPTALVPETMAAGDLRAGGSFAFVGLRGLKDFYPAYLADNLTRAGSVSARAVELTPDLDGERDLSGPGFARRFEQREFRDLVVRELEPQLGADEIVGFPAVLGLGRAREVWLELETGLERRVFEVPTLPPSVGGVRRDVHEPQEQQAHRLAVEARARVLRRVRHRGRHPAGLPVRRDGHPPVARTLPRGQQRVREQALGLRGRRHRAEHLREFHQRVSGYSSRSAAIEFVYRIRWPV